VLHAYMINTSNIQGDGSESDESSDDNDAHDDDDVESYQYGPEKMMECTVCKVMVKKDVYPYCHSYRDTLVDDSEGGAHAEDHDAHRFVYCTECKRNVTLAQSLNLSCYTYCLDSEGDVLCMSQTREERRHALHVYQKAEMERFRRKCEKELKDDYDAKLIAIREATRMEIAEETRRIHEQLSTVYSEAQAKAAEECSK
jgi:hypothetical protein